jgi:multidrug efflux pump subunit AcrA (membrane-fusion protein)
MEIEHVDQPTAPAAPTNWRRMIRLGFAVLVTTFVGLGGWSAFARLDSAVVADGTVEVESNRKTIQHLEGGIVSEILTRDGDLVHAGDVLLRLDPTRSEATDKTYRLELAIALANEARLVAQRDLLDKVQFPDEVLSQRVNRWSRRRYGTTRASSRIGAIRCCGRSMSSKSRSRRRRGMCSRLKSTSGATRSSSIRSIPRFQTCASCSQGGWWRSRA